MAYTRLYPQNIVAGGTNVEQGFINDDSELKRIYGILDSFEVVQLSGNNRQSILEGLDDASGNPAFLTASGLNVSIAATAKPLRLSFAGGFDTSGTLDYVSAILADVGNAWTLPQNQTCHLYVDRDITTGVLTFGYTLQQDLYQKTVPASPTLDLHYFDLNDSKMYVGNGSSFDAKLRKFVATSVTGAATQVLTMRGFGTDIPLVGNLTGNLTGNVTGNLTGNMTGNVTGNLTGNMTGNLTGNLTGNMTGNMTGNVTGNVTTPAGALSPFVGFKNKLINGNFSINQRAVSGTVTLAAGAYGHDRWKAGASGCTYTFATSENVTTITITSGSLLQIIEGTCLQSGTHILTWTGTAQGKIGAGSYGASGITGAVTGGTNLNIEFGTGTLAKAQFEEGSVATPFESRHVAQELLLCQRYYEKSYYLTVSPGTATFNGSIQFRSPYTGSVPFTCFFKQNKKDVPTVYVYSPNSGLKDVIFSVSSGLDNSSSSILAFENSFIMNAVMTDYYIYAFQYIANAEL